MSEENTPAVEPEAGADASPETKVEEVVDLAMVETISKEDAPEAEAQESEAESPPADEEDVEEKTDPFKERIDKLTARWRETQRTLQEREAELTRLQKQLDEAPRPQQPMKTLADFDYDESQFQGYVLERSQQVARDEARMALKEERAEQAAGKAQSEYVKQEQAFAEEHPDYRELVYDESLPISVPMAEAIRVMEGGPEVAYYLAKNPDTAADIAGMGPIQAAMMMADLRVQLRGETAKASKKVSDAPPPPPKKIGGSEPGRKVSTTSPESDKLSDAEWFKLEEARNAKARG